MTSIIVKPLCAVRRRLFSLPKCPAFLADTSCQKSLRATPFSSAGDRSL
jgi:hypothetical protein